MPPNKVMLYDMFNQAVQEHDRQVDSAAADKAKAKPTGGGVEVTVQLPMKKTMRVRVQRGLEGDRTRRARNAYIRLLPTRLMMQYNVI